MKLTTRNRAVALLVTPLAVAGLAACGGSVTSGGGAGGDSGFAFGADQSEVDKAIADLDPVTLTIQPYAASPDAAAAIAEKTFMDAVKERSGGKIDFDIAWGQSIAPYSEVDDALADGRLDIAYAVNVYYPAEYPVFDAYNKMGHYAPAGPVTGEAVVQAQMSEAGWNNENILAEYTEKGLQPLNPLVTSGNYWAACNAEGTGLSDWEGRQIRIGGSAQTPISQNLNASPVSMEYGEVFEALQRSTVDCTFIQGMVAGSTGLLEVAPYVSTLGNEHRMTGAMTAGHVAGQSFSSLPLAYQQIIFDAAGVDWFDGILHAIAGSSATAVSDSRNAGGSVIEMDPAARDNILASQEEIVDDLIASGVIAESDREALQESGTRWAEVVSDLGYTDGGELAELDNWYSPEEYDFRPLAEQVFEAGAIDHRPGS